MEAKMSERKLASVQKVQKIYPIVGADKIETANVLGWEVVVKKNEFSENELAVYIEIDSVLPENAEWCAFMASRNFRVKTAKFKGQISQGLLIPLSKFPELSGKKVCEDDDLTKILNIKKYNPELLKEEENIRKQTGIKKNWFLRKMLSFSLGRKIYFFLYKKGAHNFPTYLVPATDETRIQAIPNFEQMVKAAVQKGKTFYVTEKVDGCSATYVLDVLDKNKLKNKILNFFLKPKFLIASRNYVKSVLDGTHWPKVAIKYNIEQILRKEYKNGNHYAIQGEIIGPKIQKNKYQKEDFEFYVFNLYNVSKQQYCNIENLISFCNNHNLNTVPVLNLDYSIKEKTVRQILEEAAGISKLFPVKREGIVIRTKDKQLSFKAIDPEFLLINEE
jgi:hypothetical protein